MGFTQRQAAGKFTRTEAEGLLERLQNPEEDTAASREVPIWRRSVQDDVLNQIPAERLAPSNFVAAAGPSSSLRTDRASAYSPMSSCQTSG